MAEASDTSSTSAPQHEPYHADPHPAWFADLVRVEDAVEGASDDVMNQLVSLADDLAGRIATTPATTRAGVIAQLRPEPPRQRQADAAHRHDDVAARRSRPAVYRQESSAAIVAWVSPANDWPTWRSSSAGGRG